MTECRFFVGNIPSSATEDELKSEFAFYGQVKSVELKKKGDENCYGFVNLEIDDKLVQKCIREFTQQKFKGNYLSVSKAKESFLDRLKKEREQDNHIGSRLIEMSMKSNAELEHEIVSTPLPVIQREVPSEESSEEEEELPPKIIKPSMPKKFDNSFTNNFNNHYQTKEEPILDKAKLDDMKRQKSLQALKDMHKEKKDAIRNALLSIDSTAPRNNKIIFEPPEPKKTPNNESRKNLLFDEENGDEEEEEEETPESFKLKKQFAGKKGEKLFELQTKYQNDKRFKIDEKFADGTDEFIDSRKKYTREELKERKRLRKELENWDQNELKEERDHQLSILESITGESTGRLEPRAPREKIGMLRFDPTKESHLKYLDLVKGDEKIEDDKEESDIDMHENTQNEEDEKKERFYEVSENLTDAFKSSNSESKPFSIFGMLGIDNTDEVEDEKPQEKEEIKLPPKVQAFHLNQVKFKYDSSDTDEEAEKVKESRKKKLPQKKSKHGKYSKAGVFRHNFFIADGDERLKEGFAFLKKASNVPQEEFNEKRKKLKKVIKSQIRKAKSDKEKSSKKRKV